ncbi:MAG: C40 family peptidase [Frankiaceae bacterium]|nr:C40 family peptidase [Frankiaceae bacterium]
MSATSAAPQVSLNQVLARIDALNTQAEKITEAYDAARESLAVIRREQSVASDDLGRQRAVLSAWQKKIGLQANLAYRNGDIGGISSVITSNDPQSFLDSTSLLDAVSRNQASQLAAVAAAHRAVDGATALLTAKATAAKQALAAITAQRAQIEGLLHQAQALYGSLRAADRARLAQQRAAAASAATSMRSSYSGPATGRAAAAVRFAYAQLGKPYVYGASGPDSYDCSGLTMRAWGAAGVSLSHNAAAQQSETRYVSYSDLQPGDLVFFGSPAGHVGIYIGNGQMIAAPHTGDVVKIQSVSGHGGFSGGGRP